MAEEIVGRGPRRWLGMEPLARHCHTNLTGYGGRAKPGLVLTVLDDIISFWYG